MVHWPDNPGVSITRVKEIEGGASSNVSNLSLGTHTGTHVDAPVHYLPGGAGVDALDLDALIGPARVIEIRNPEAIGAANIDENRISRGERVLFRTRNSIECWTRDEFCKDFVFIRAEAAQRLVQVGARTVGIDYLSVGGFRKPDGRATHAILLGAGIAIIEGLDLSSIAQGEYEMICLPLRIVGGDASPARVLLRSASR
jgi:arylformamidase